VKAAATRSIFAILKIHKNAFAAGTLPHTSVRAPPDPELGGEKIPSHFTPTPLVPALVPKLL